MLDPIVAEEERPTTLLAVLRSYPNQSLWRDVDLDGDGEWIIDGLARGSLAIVHDGSFMEHLDETSCSAGGIIFCNAWPPSQQRNAPTAKLQATTVVNFSAACWLLSSLRLQLRSCQAMHIRQW
jgi:hypothetical protein